MKGGTVRKVNNVWEPIRERTSGIYDHPYYYSLHEANALNTLGALPYKKDADTFENGRYWDSSGYDSPQSQFQRLNYENKKRVVDELKKAIEFRNLNDGTKIGFAQLGNDAKSTTHTH
jgi:hypothetical protein